jgi:hypothetical protein
MEYLFAIAVIAALGYFVYRQVTKTKVEPTGTPRPGVGEPNQNEKEK